MSATQEDRRKTEALPHDGIVRPHNASTLIKASLELQRAGRSREAFELLAGAGFADEDAARILRRGEVRTDDVPDT